MAAETRPDPGSSRVAVGFLLDCLQEGSEPLECRPADWAAVADLAERHQVAALLYRRLEAGDRPEPVPADARARLRRAYYRTADRNIRRFRQLGPVLCGLRSAGIPVVVLKGALLAELVYGNIALRPMGDADLLVPRAELARARALLVEAGWANAAGDIETACRTYPDLGVFDKQGLWVEVHWTIEQPASPFRIDPAGLWERARPARVAGVEVRTLCPEDLLLHLCLHAGYHHEFAAGLLPFCDIARVIERFRAELDWPGLARTARDWGAGRYAGLGLELARVLLRARVPADALAELVPGGFDPAVVETARECVMAFSSCRQGAARPLRALVGTGSVGDRFGVFRRRLWPSRESLAAVYRGLPGAESPGRLRARWFGHLARSGWCYLVRPRLARLGLTGRGPDRTAALADWLDRGGGGREQG
ncbi:MAG: nucleotidyltransferase family protein [bacterium]